MQPTIQPPSASGKPPASVLAIAAHLLKADIEVSDDDAVVVAKEDPYMKFEDDDPVSKKPRMAQPVD